MRSTIHDTPVHFRANSMLVAAAAQKARREGMSFSELMRHALRQDVREEAA